MASLVKILVVSASGYQGSTLIRPLLAHKDKYRVTAIEKAGNAAKQLKEQGCTVIEGDPASPEVLQKAATDADVVFSLAISNKLDAVKALVQGLKPKGMVLDCLIVIQITRNLTINLSNRKRFGCGLQKVS
jgi:N-acetyl-gamma-glutamylphosphate reductase